MLSNGLEDDNLGLQAAGRCAETLRASRIYSLIASCVQGGLVDKARRLTTQEDLGTQKGGAILVLAQQEYKAAAEKQIPAWVDDLESPVEKAWAYLGCCEALLEANKATAVN